MPQGKADAKCKNDEIWTAWVSGGGKGGRTPDLVIANDALYQLSYAPHC